MSGAPRTAAGGMPDGRTPAAGSVAGGTAPSTERVERRGAGLPFLSICIPQHNRTSFLLAACRTYAEQEFRDFELCISDDRSTDGRQGELLAWLEGSGLPFVWERRPKNLRYDGNLRSALALARGRFALLMGNDDGLAAPDALATLHAALLDAAPPDAAQPHAALPHAAQPDAAQPHAALPDPGQVVALTNYLDATSGRVFRRVRRGGVLGVGAQTAAARFRDFSFVSGVVLPTRAAQALATDRWDGSEFYQTWLACRLMASGLPLVGVPEPLVAKDLRVEGESVESYVTVAPRDRAFRERTFNLVGVPRLVADAIAPGLKPAEARRLGASLVWQTYAVTYGYWLVEFRRVRSWRYAAGVAWGMRPGRVHPGVPLTPLAALRLRLVWGAVTAAGLLLPVRLARRLERPLYAAAKALSGRG